MSNLTDGSSNHLQGFFLEGASPFPHVYFVPMSSWPLIDRCKLSDSESEIQSLLSDDLHTLKVPFVTRFLQPKDGESVPEVASFLWCGFSQSDDHRSNAVCAISSGTPTVSYKTIPTY